MTAFSEAGAGAGKTETAHRPGHRPDHPAAGDRRHRVPPATAARTRACPRRCACACCRPSRPRSIAGSPDAGTVTDHEARTLAFDERRDAGGAAAARHGVRRGRHPGQAARGAPIEALLSPAPRAASRSISRCATACAPPTTGRSCARPRSSWPTSSGWSTSRWRAWPSWWCGRASRARSSRRWPRSARPYARTRP